MTYAPFGIDAKKLAVATSGMTDREYDKFCCENYGCDEPECDTNDDDDYDDDE